MNTIKKIVLLVTVMIAISVSLAGTVIDEGLLLDGVEGVVRKVDKVDVWQFVPSEATALTDKITWPAGQTISLLPCSVLEQITTMAGEETEIEVRLWALFTAYDKHNYLYSVFFLPVKAQPAETEDNNTEENGSDDNGDDDDSIIPADILNQIKETKTPDLDKFRQLAKVTGDVNLIGRSGYLKQEGKLKFFQPDAFGRKIDRSQYRLLPCGPLKSAERKMQQAPGRQRYSVSGLVTEYKGRQYILLRRASRTYTHGNFTP